MPYLATVTINSSLCIFNTIVNMFFSFCLIFPTEPGQRKQPVTLLLALLISCSLFYSVSTVAGLFWERMTYEHFVLSMLIVDCTVDLSMVSYVWLSFYFYIQIVPALCPLSHWVKRNIKTSIYVLLALDILVVISTKLNMYVLDKMVWSLHLAHPNSSTWDYPMPEEFYRLRALALYPVMLHYAALLCVSMVSSLSTVRHLHKHMTTLAAMGASVSAARLRGQIRVTVTGAVQAVFFSVLAVYFLFQCFTSETPQFYLNISITFTVTSLFVSGTTVTLGINQSVFRHRIVSVFGAIRLGH
ncbi:unnamed protein product [Knipowitschia caucasica]